MIALCFLVMAGQAIGQSAAAGLFFDRIGTDALPRAYLLQGGGTLAVMLAAAAVLGRWDQRPAFLVMSAGLAILVFAERAVLIADPAWIYWALWLTVAIAILLQTVIVWGIAGVATDTRQAKRLFPLFAAGGILGAVVGGLLTAPLVTIIGAADLVLVWGGILVGALALARMMLPGAGGVGVRPLRRRRPSVLGDLSAALRYVAGSRLLTWMTLGAILFSVLFYSLFLPWASGAAGR